MLEEKNKLISEVNIPENLEKHNSKIRKIFKITFIGLGIFFIAIGILAPIILLFMAGGMGWWLPLIGGVAEDYTPGCIGLGIVLILIGKIFIERAILWKRILSIIFIILVSPFIFKATIGTVVGLIYLNKNTVTKEGITEISQEEVKKITRKALSLENENECRKLIPFYFLPPSLASILLPEFFNPYPHPIIFLGGGTATNVLYGIYSEGVTQCVAEVAAKKEDAKICEEFPSIPFDRENCLFIVSQKLIGIYNDPKYCDLLKGLWNPTCGFQKCISDLATIKRDPPLCKRIKTEEGSWCGITNQEYYKRCIKGIPGLTQEEKIKYFWNLYKNTDHGYEIMLPQNWHFTEFDDIGLEHGIDKACFLEGGTKCSTWEELLFYTIGPKGTSVETSVILNSLYKNSWPDSCKVSLENPPEFLPRFLSWNAPKLVKTETEQIKNSNYYFEKFYYVPDKDVAGMKQNLLAVRWCRDNTSKLGAMMIYYNDESDENLKTFEQILSTFKFTD